MSHEMRRVATSATAAATTAKAQLDSMASGVTAPLTSVQALTDAFRNGATEIDIFGAGVKKAAKGSDEIKKMIPSLLQVNAVQDAVTGSMERGLMAIVDGTSSVKNAFKSMASEIIKELYRIFVVKKITGMVANAISLYSGTGMTSAPIHNPLEGLSGSQMLPRRAMGGQVTGGRPYMVGERGPEMIVPQRNGNVVPNNQLGGGGVTVVQNINVSTGVQQTVRAEIKTLMPQIAEASKAAVADAVRRGGSYGRAFA